MGAADLDAPARLPSRPGTLRAEAEAHFEAAEADFRRALRAGLDAGVRYVLQINRGVMRFQRGRLDEAAADFRAGDRGSTRGRYNAHGLAGPGPRTARAGTTRRSRSSTGPSPCGPTWPPCYRDRALMQARRRDPAGGRGGAGPGRPRPRRSAASRPAARAAPATTPGGPACCSTWAATARPWPPATRPWRSPPTCRAHPTASRPSRAEAVRRGGRVLRRRPGRRARRRPSCTSSGGLARASRRDFAGAIEDYTQALASGRPGRAVLIHRGWAYLVANAPRLALRDFEEAVRLDPVRPRRLHRPGRCPGPAPGQHRAAVADAEESLGTASPTPRRLYAAADLCPGRRGRRRRGPPPGPAGPARGPGLPGPGLALLARSLERTPADRREAFWREVVEPDAAWRRSAASPAGILAERPMSRPR